MSENSKMIKRMVKANSHGKTANFTMVNGSMVRNKEMACGLHLKAILTLANGSKAKLKDKESILLTMVKLFLCLGQQF